MIRSTSLLVAAGALLTTSCTSEAEKSPDPAREAASSPDVAGEHDTAGAHDAAVDAAGAAAAAAAGDHGGDADAEPMLARHDAKEAAALLESDPSIKVLDVRTQREWDEQGHLKGAMLLDYQGGSEAFRDQVAELDKNQAWLVHCAAGGRSMGAVKIMQELGFKKLHHLDPGFRGWVAADLPVEK